MTEKENNKKPRTSLQTSIPGGQHEDSVLPERQNTKVSGLVGFIQIIRPKQWIKNAFVFIPVFFGGLMLDTGGVCAALITFVAFCLTASSVYCFNDIVDVADDRRHPVKCRRPIAAGTVSVAQGYMLMSAMLLLSAGAVAVLPQARWQVAVVIGGYYLLNLAYCVWLKQYAIIDVCTVAFGFVLRILAGGVATGIVLSHWIVLMTFLLTLFLSLAKRRDDVLRMNRTGEPPRKSASRYNLTFINQAITITATVTIVCYIMYTVSPEVISMHRAENLYLTSLFVIIGLLRYLQIAMVDEQSGDPTKVMWRDRVIQMIVICWGLSFLVIIYF